MIRRTVKKTKRKSTQNNYLLSAPSYLGDKNIPMTIELTQYDSTHVEIRDIPLQASLKKHIDKTKVNWFRITGISDASVVDKVCHEFGLHVFDVKDLLSDRQVVKVVSYDDVLFILASSFYREESGAVDDIQVAFILGKNYIVSFQEASIPIFDEVKKNIEENNLLIRKKNSDFLLYILMNAVHVSTTNTVMSVEDELAEIEDQLIQKRNSTKDILQYLHSCRINYMHIKRSVVSLREEYSNLLHNTGQLIRDDNMVYFNDFDDRMRSIIGDLASFHESLTSLLDLYYNNNNLKLNEIMKRLTIVSTLFIPLTFMVGVWGMNFKFMPETDWEHGYMFAWLILAVIGLSTFLWMKKQKWF
ncbi:MAG: magnesium/cobalt transporter CorA [Dysgonomonas sp.]|nr:magnesium/cobalt transporter CorA [Dysgonomonas sp.]